MAHATIEVFYSPTCPNCPPQKNLAKQVAEDTVTVNLTDVTQQVERARSFGVRSVPTTIVYGSGIQENAGFRGVMTEDRLQTAIRVAKGNKDISSLKKPTIVDKLKGLLS